MRLDASGVTHGTSSSQPTSHGTATESSDGASSRPCKSHRPSSVLQTGCEAARQPAELATAGPAWQALWAQREEPLPSERELRESVRQLPAFPQPPPIGAAATAAGIWALPLGRAPGPGSWTAESSAPPMGSAPRRRTCGPLRRGGTRRGVANGVGRGRRRPLAQARRFPSAGSAAAACHLAPGDLSAIWARLRLAEVEHWRAQWGPAANDAPKGPDGQGWGLSWDLACAEVAGSQA